jgi:hypothetical protein
LLTKGRFSPDSFDIFDYEYIKLCDLDSSDIIVNKFSMEMEASIKVTNRVFLNGGDFRIGSFVLIKFCSQSPEFGKIKNTILEEDKCNLLVSKFLGEYDFHLASFKLEFQESLTVVNISDLEYYLPLYSVNSFRFNDINDYIVLPLKNI